MFDAHWTQLGVQNKVQLLKDIDQFFCALSKYFFELSVSLDELEFVGGERL